MVLARWVSVPGGAAVLVGDSIRLSGRGTAQARALGRWFAAEAGAAPTAILVSPYRRTRETAARRAAGAWEPAMSASGRAKLPVSPLALSTKHKGYRGWRRRRWGGRRAATMPLASLPPLSPRHA